jgi:hypothetical protein
MSLLRSNNNLGYSTTKCYQCKDFWAPVGDIFCSKCRKIHNGEIYSDDEAKKVLEKNCRFVNKKVIKNTFDTLIRLNYTPTPNEIYYMIKGITINKTWISANTAQEFYDYLIWASDLNDKYDYIHAIYPFVYDWWNIDKNNKIAFCQYGNSGNFGNIYYYKNQDIDPEYVSPRQSFIDF